MNQVSKKQGHISKENEIHVTVGEAVNIAIPHVGEQIFQNVSTDDLLQCMKVCKVWRVLAEKVFFQRWKGNIMEACRTGRTETVQLLLDNFYR